MLSAQAFNTIRKNLSALVLMCATGIHGPALSADASFISLTTSSVSLQSTALPQSESHAQGKSSVDIPALTIVCWHDVRDQLLDGFAKNPDTTAVDTRDLIAQFELIRDLGYTPISLDQWTKGRAGLITLPAKPILLSFDDGYRSLHDKVLPLLRLYGYPAVAAIVSDWVQPDEQAAQATRKFVTRSELKAVQLSGLVEIASHSHDMHQGVTANPQGNEQPAANVRAWLGDRYESDEAYIRRVRSDLNQSAQALEAITGVRPRVMVWPYGAYNHLAAQAAQAAGYEVAMSLESGLNQAQGSPMQMRRLLVETAMGMTDFARALIPAENGLEVVAEHQATAGRASAAALELGTIRSLRVALDSIHDPDPARQEQNLSALLEKVRKLGVNTVMLDAFSIETDSGRVTGTWFPSSVLPLKADLFNRVSWQLRTRVDVKVFAVMPLASLSLSDQGHALTLAQDLGRHVPMTGLVIDTTGNAAASAITATVLARNLTASVRVYHPELLTVLAADAGTTLALKPSAWVQALDGFDYLMLTRHDAPDAQDFELTPEQLYVRSLQRNTLLNKTLAVHALGDRVIVSSALPVAQLPGLLAGPVRHLSVDLQSLQAAPRAWATLQPLLSTATRHNPRK